MDRVQFDRLTGYLQDSLPATQREQLENELKNDSQLAEKLIATAFEEALLREWAQTRQQSLEIDETLAEDEIRTQLSPNSEQQGRVRLRQALIVACSFAIILAGIWFWRPPASEGPVASLDNVSGGVEVIHADGRAEAGANGRTIGLDQQLNLTGPRSTASVVYPDGSRLMLAGLGRIRLEGRGGKRIRIAHGQVGAQIAHQDSGEKLQFLTPTARLDVIGTQFSLEASAQETEVSVIEGRVKLTRTSDGQSVDLSAGSRALAGTNQSQLVAVKIESSPARYDVDFEQGLPPGWQAGHAVREGDPPRAGVRAEATREADGIVYGITSPKAWRDGLFSWERDEHLNFTYKLDKPDWFQIFISTRAMAGDKPPIATYRFKDERLWWPFEPGQWRTVSIPLTAFGRVSDWSETPLSVGELPFELIFTSKDNNLSLVIDRIWISSGGPGTFTVREEE